jgi:MYND finger
MASAVDMSTVTADITSSSTKANIRGLRALQGLLVDRAVDPLEVYSNLGAVLVRMSCGWSIVIPDMFSAPSPKNLSRERIALALIQELSLQQPSVTDHRDGETGDDYDESYVKLDVKYALRIMRRCVDLHARSKTDESVVHVSNVISVASSIMQTAFKKVPRGRDAAITKQDALDMSRAIADLMNAMPQLIEGMADATWFPTLHMACEIVVMCDSIMHHRAATSSADVDIAGVDRLSSTMVMFRAVLDIVPLLAERIAAKEASEPLASQAAEAIKPIVRAVNSVLSAAALLISNALNMSMPTAGLFVKDAAKHADALATLARVHVAHPLENSELMCVAIVLGAVRPDIDDIMASYYIDAMRLSLRNDVPQQRPFAMAMSFCTAAASIAAANSASNGATATKTLASAKRMLSLPVDDWNVVRSKLTAASVALRVNPSAGIDDADTKSWIIDLSKFLSTMQNASDDYWPPANTMMQPITAMCLEAVVSLVREILPAIGFANHVFMSLEFIKRRLRSIGSSASIGGTPSTTSTNPEPIAILPPAGGPQPNPPQGRSCETCGISAGVKLRSCMGCREMWYCSTECQKRHWCAGHKQSCPRIDRKEQQHQQQQP